MGAASPKPLTPAWRSSTCTTSAVSAVSRAITNVSASCKVTIRASRSTRATLPRQAPVAQGIERAPPERKAAGSIPAGRITGWRSLVRGGSQRRVVGTTAEEPTMEAAAPAAYSMSESLTAAATVLIVDDDDGTLALLETILAPLDANVVSARSGEEALEHALREEVAVILLDVAMPGMDGFETARRLKELDALRHVPVIFLTGMAERSEIARGYSAGAADYLLKPYEPEILRSKVQVFVDLYRLRKQAEILTHRALHDPLTGLPNRTLLLDRLEMALRRVDRSGKRVALLFIDLDNFKSVNDTRGHHAGDALLVDAANRLQHAIRASDTAARFGGDEFVVLCDGVDDVREAEAVATRISSGLERSGLSASIGITRRTARHGSGGADPRGRRRHAFCKGRVGLAVNLRD